MEKLNSTAIEQLIARYQQELEKLRFQTMKTKDTIHELKEGLKVAKEQEASVLQEIREKQQQASDEAVEKIQQASSTGPKAKSTASKKPSKAKAKAKPKAKPKSRSSSKKSKRSKNSDNDRSRGYRLSPVDELVMEALEAREMPLKTAELHEYSAAHMGEKGESYDDERLRILISRSLQKLANRRDDVIKMRNPDERGHLYALPNWFNGPIENKKLKKKFQRK